MKNWTIKKQVLFLSSIMLSIQVVIACLGFFALYSIKGHLESVFEVRLPSLNALVQADRDYQQMLVAERSLMIDGLSESQKNTLKEEYLKNKVQVAERFEAYRKIGLSSKELELIESFEKSLKKWDKLSTQDFIISANGELSINTNNRAQLVEKSFGSINLAFEESRNNLDKLQDLILGYGTHEFKSANDTYHMANQLIIGISALSILLSLALTVFFSRRINTRISQIADAISHQGSSLQNISNSLSDKSNEMSSVSTQLSSAAAETTSSLHEITQMVKNNTDGANKVSSLVSKSKTSVEKGINNLDDLIERIKGLEGSSLNLVKTVENSNEKLAEIINVFQEVNEKTKVINDIVFQTKLLSFNASVEAARAGENGKGFSVVAEEVGNLAKMSGESAGQISILLEQSLRKVTEIVESSKDNIANSIKSNQDYVNESVNLSNQCREVFIEVSQDFIDVASSSQQVSDASNEQLSGVEEVNRAVQEISSAATSTSSSANTVNASSAAVKASVNEISRTIGDLNSLVNSDNNLHSRYETNDQTENYDEDYYEDSEYSDVA